MSWLVGKKNTFQKLLLSVIWLMLMISLAYLRLLLDSEKQDYNLANITTTIVFSVMGNYIYIWMLAAILIDWLIDNMNAKADNVREYKAVIMLAICSSILIAIVTNLQTKLIGFYSLEFELMYFTIVSVLMIIMKFLCLSNLESTQLKKEHKKL